MPQTITNPELIELINKNATEMKAIKAKERETIDALEKEIFPRIDALNLENQKFVNMMNEEYGWGNWQDFNAEELTFIPREEFEGRWYVVENPALRPAVKVDDIELNTPDEIAAAGNEILEDAILYRKELEEAANLAIDTIMNAGTLPAGAECSIYQSKEPIDLEPEIIN